MPAPHTLVLQMHSVLCIAVIAGDTQAAGCGVVSLETGKARALDLMRAISSAGVSAGFTAFISPAVAATSGEEKLVPKEGFAKGVE